jgi:hypothetical protein
MGLFRHGKSSAAILAGSLPPAEGKVEQGFDRRVHHWMLWLWTTQWLYPETYRLKTSHERQESLRGVQLGQNLQQRDLNCQPVDFFLALGYTVQEIRTTIGLTVSLISLV